MCLISLSCAAHADTVTNRFVCASDAGFRSIELSYINEVGSVPCAIRETREDGQKRLLWQANFDEAFCHRQMKEHRARLVALGWSCKTDPVNELLTSPAPLATRSRESGLLSQRARSPYSTTATEARLPPASMVNSDTQPSLSSITVTASSIVDLTPLSASAVRMPVTNRDRVNESSAGTGLVTAESRARTSEVVFYEDNPDSDSVAPETSDKPLPPSVAGSQLNGEDIRQIDDWLMYLSAQSMASIRHIMGDQQSFDEYQLAEDLKSDDIYSRLQNRIEFLQSLLEKQ